MKINKGNNTTEFTSMLRYFKKVNIGKWNKYKLYDSNPKYTKYLKLKIFVVKVSLKLNKITKAVPMVGIKV